MPHGFRACPDCGAVARRCPGARCHRCASIAKTGGRLNTPPPEERFWRFVEKTDGCWNWTGATNGHGYGRLTFDGRKGIEVSQRKIGAHRFAYELLVGPVPDGLDLDHLCRNRLCVNPAHLEPVTRAENLRRASLRRDALGRFARAA